MSIIDWFKNVVNGIGKAFRDLMNKAKPFLAKEVPVAIAWVNTIKGFVDSPLVDFATATIKGDFDNKVVTKAREVLPKLLVELKLFQTAELTGSNEQIFHAVITYLKSISPDKRYGKYLEIASYLTLALTDSKLDWSEIVHVVQIAYDKEVHNVAIAA